MQPIKQSKQQPGKQLQQTGRHLLLVFGMTDCVPKASLNRSAQQPPAQKSKERVSTSRMIRPALTSLWDPDVALKGGHRSIGPLCKVLGSPPVLLLTVCGFQL